MKVNTPGKLRKHSYGVLTGNSLAHWKYGKPSIHKFEAPFTSAGDVATFCRNAGVMNVWLLPDSTVSKQFKDASFINAALNQYKFERVEEETNYLYMYRKEGTYEEKLATMFTIPDSTYSHWSIPIEPALKAGDFFMLLTMASELPVDVLCSPSYTGKRLLEYTCLKDSRAHWLDKCDFVPTDDMACGDISWMCKRKLENKKYLHAYDKGTAYGAACLGTLFGEGTPQYIEHANYHAQRVGIWKVHVRSKSIFDGVQLPLPYHEETQWMWSNTLSSMLQHGIDFSIEGAYIWDKAHVTLRELATTMWDTRQLIKSKELYAKYPLAQAVADKWLKDSLRHTIGSFLTTYEGHVTPLYRRDFNFIVKAENKKRMLLEVERQYNATGEAPIAGYNDCWYYLSDNPNPNLAIGDITRNAGKQGGFTVKGTCNWLDIKDAFYAGDMINFLHTFNVLTESEE